MNIFRNIPLLFLSFILIGGFLVRLYGFNKPIADWHSWRQADTSAVSRNFIKNGFDILHPRFDDLSNVPSGIYDNPKGYRFVEFPLYNIFQAGLFQLFPFFTLEEWGRIISIFSSLGIMVFLYLIVSRHANKTIGLLSAFFFAFIPYNIYYGRTILPDMTMVMAILGGIYFFDLWIEENSKFKIISFFILATIFTLSAFLLKPYALFFTLPMIYLAWKKFDRAILKQWQLWVFTVLSLTPFIFWRLWIQQYPEGIPQSVWLLNGNGIRFRPSFFRWIFYERITKLISGYTGILFLLVAAIRIKLIKQHEFFYTFLVSSLLYIIIFATGNVQHDYYQILIMPTLVMFYGIGVYYLFFWSVKKIPLGKILIVLCSAGLFFIGWNQVKDYYNINNPEILLAGKAVDTFTPPDAKIVAPYGGDTTLLYQTKRKGWASFSHSLEKLILQGADYLLLINPNEKDYGIGKQYKIVSATEQYILFDLHRKP